MIRKIVLVILFLFICSSLLFSIIFMGYQGDVQNLVSRSDIPQSPNVPPSFYLFVVLDDAGMSMEEVDRFSTFPGRYTIAIIPRLENSRKIAQYLYAHDMPYILHIPMQAIDDTVYAETYMIKDTMSDTEILDTLAYNFTDIENFLGFNNHMGSKATTNPRMMDLLMQYVQDSPYLVLDSRTTSHTILADKAREWGVESIEKDLFIDNFDDYQYITQKIREGMSIAKQKGYAVLIGHVTRRETSKALESMYSEVIAHGGAFKGLDEISLIRE